MRTFPVIKTLVAVLFIASIATSCKKDRDIKKREFEVRTKTWYRVAPTAPVPVVVNGTTYSGFNYFPGGGTGTATYMGEVSNYFTQLAYGISPEAPPLGSVSTPLRDVPSYPILGGPLPLIQPGDFSDLAKLIQQLQIPAQVDHHIINSVLNNSKGDAIFLTALTGTSRIVPLSATVAGFSGKGLILGGRGKFTHAVGEFDFSGYFSLVNPNDAEYNAKGWISF
jgi:hypothetical protein